VTGASRGIGKAIALRAAQDGASITVIGKTDKPHPKLPGTVHSAAAEIEAAGGQALICVCDIRHDDEVERAVELTVEHFGGIDILVNNASAISRTNTESTPMKRFDLMHQVNTRGSFMCAKLCLPHLRKSDSAHILNLAPPLNFEERWFAPHTAYSIAKFGMSLCVLGMAGEFRQHNIRVNALWPRSIIATAAVANLLGGEQVTKRARSPSIVADAAHLVLTNTSLENTGQFLIDEDVLRDAGITNLDQYAVTPGQRPLDDLFV
jgi:citronellol/citronellal dehydrogenase